MYRSQTNETPACCCLDVGTVLDNSDCQAHYRQLFSNQQQAQAACATLTEKARQVQSEPCQIRHCFTADDQYVRLDMQFIFACQAEAMIFQLGLRQTEFCRMQSIEAIVPLDNG